MANDDLPFWRAGGFLPGILLGAVLSLSGLVTYLAMNRAAPTERVETPPPPPMVVERPPAPAPARPRPPAPAPAPPRPPGWARGQILDPTLYDDASCAKAFASGGDVPNDLLYACANSNRLGACHLTNSCPTCACESYARSDLICKTDGCAAPINGTGCVNSGFFRPDTLFFGCQGDQLTLGACMMRKLLAQGLCTKQ